MRQGLGNYWGGAQNVGVHRKSPLCRNPGGREQSPLKLSHFETDDVSKLPEIFIYYYSSSSLLPRPVARIDFLGGCGTPKKWTFWTSPPIPLTKTPFLAHFVAKSGPFGRFGGCIPPPGYGPASPLSFLFLFLSFHFTGGEMCSLPFLWCTAWVQVSFFFHHTIWCTFK